MGELRMVEETRNCLASHFKFSCNTCNTEDDGWEPITFSSSKKAAIDGVKQQHQPHAVNLSAAYGAMNIGCGAHDFFAQAAIMDIPLDQDQWKKSYYKNEKLIGVPITRYGIINHRKAAAGPVFATIVHTK